MAELEIDKKAVIDEFLKSKDFIDLINAEKGKVVDAFQKEKLPSILDAEFEKRTKLLEEKNKKTPEQIQLDEALKRIEKMEADSLAEKREKLRLENKNRAFSEIANKNLKVPETILDKLISSEPEETTKNVKTFIDFIADYTSSIKTEKIKSNNAFEPGKDPSGGGSIPIPDENATVADWEKYHRATRKK